MLFLRRITNMMSFDKKESFDNITSDFGVPTPFVAKFTVCFQEPVLKFHCSLLTLISAAVPSFRCLIRKVLGRI